MSKQGRGGRERGERRFSSFLLTIPSILLSGRMSRVVAWDAVRAAEGGRKWKADKT